MDDGSEAAAAAAAAAAADPLQQHADHKPWTVPADYLPVPAGFDAEQQPVSLREFSHSQLMQLAEEYNEESGILEDPFEAVLKGIPERAQLRPNHKEPESNYMGLQGLPPTGKYAKAWRKILRGSRQLDVGEAAAAPPAKRAKASDLSKAKTRGTPKADKAAADKPSQWTRQQLQPALSPEQQRWRKQLAAFLGRPVDVPLLAPGAPVLDLQKLFLEVMAQGGYDQVSAADGWVALAQHMQRDPVFAPLVAAVYACYLHPLEQDLPFACRPAKAFDHISNRVQSRTLLGARLATFEGVVFAADRAEQLLRQLQQQQPQAQQLSQQQQQQPSPQASVQQAGRSRAAPALPPAAGAGGAAGEEQQRQLLQQRSGVDVVRCSLQLLQAAAQDPGLVLDLQRQHGLRSGLHAASRAACQQEYRKKLQATFKRWRSPSNTFELEFDALPDAVLFGADVSDASDKDDSDSSDSDGDDDDDDSLGGPATASTAAAAGSSLAEAAAGGATAAAAAAAAGGGEGELPDTAASGGRGRRGRGRPPGRGRGRGRSPGTGRGRGRGRPPGRGRGRGLGDAARAGSVEPADSEGPSAAAELAEQTQQQQQQQVWRTDPIAHDAARWLLLSRRAALSGPPGCKQPLLQLPGMQERQQDKRGPSASSGGRSRGKGQGRSSRSGGEQRRQRTFLGLTPRCGSCHTCLNPQLRKACPVNRKNLQLGLKLALPTGRGRGRGSRGGSGRGRRGRGGK